MPRTSPPQAVLDWYTRQRRGLRHLGYLVPLCIFTWAFVATHVGSYAHSSTQQLRTPAPALSMSYTPTPPSSTTPSHVTMTGRGAGNQGGDSCPANTPGCATHISGQDVTNGANQISTSETPDVVNSWLQDSKSWIPSPWSQVSQIWIFQTYINNAQGPPFVYDIAWKFVLLLDSFAVCILLFRVFSQVASGRFSAGEMLRSCISFLPIVILAHTGIIFVTFWVSLNNNLCHLLYTTVVHTLHNAGLPAPHYPTVTTPYNNVNDNTTVRTCVKRVGKFCEQIVTSNDPNQIELFSNTSLAIPRAIAWGEQIGIYLMSLDRVLGVQLLTMFSGAIYFDMTRKEWFMGVINALLGQTIQVAALLLGGALAVVIQGQHPDDVTQMWLYVAVLLTAIQLPGILGSAVTRIGVEGAQVMASLGTQSTTSALEGRFMYDQGWHKFTINLARTLVLLALSLLGVAAGLLARFGLISPATARTLIQVSNARAILKPVFYLQKLELFLRPRLSRSASSGRRLSVNNIVLKSIRASIIALRVTDLRNPIALYSFVSPYVRAYRVRARQRAAMHPSSPGAGSRHTHAQGNQPKPMPTPPSPGSTHSSTQAQKNQPHAMPTPPPPGATSRHTRAPGNQPKPMQGPPPP